MRKLPCILPDLVHRRDQFFIVLGILADPYTHNDARMGIGGELDIIGRAIAFMRLLPAVSLFLPLPVGGLL
jgi:hypothetical protein